MNNDWLDIAVLEDYLDGKLDARTMNRVEREALEDPFVAEALAGLSMSPKRSLESISLLQKQLQARVAEQQHTKKAAVITWQRLSIAATAAVLFISVGIIFWMKQVNYQQTAANQPKKVEVNIAPKPADATVAAEPAVSDQVAIAVDKASKATKDNAYASLKSKEIRPVIVAKDAVPAARMQSAAVMMAVQNSQNIVQGKVVGADDGKPLTGVSVRLKGSSLTANTDVNGQFSLVSTDTIAKDAQVVVNYIGYESQDVQVSVNQSLNVALKPQHAALNEVVIVGYGNQKKESLTGKTNTVSNLADTMTHLDKALQGRAAGIHIRGTSSFATEQKLSSNPAGGWSKLYDYLIENNKFKNEPRVGKSVEVRFAIGKDGKPEKIELLQKLDKKYNDEAIRLLLEGPKWTKPEKASSRITFKIEF